MNKVGPKMLIFSKKQIETFQVLFLREYFRPHPILMNQQCWVLGSIKIGSCYRARSQRWGGGAFIQLVQNIHYTYTEKYALYTLMCTIYIYVLYMHHCILVPHSGPQKEFHGEIKLRKGNLLPIAQFPDCTQCGLKQQACTKSGWKQQARTLSGQKH